MGSFKRGFFFFNFVGHLKNNWRLRWINIRSVCHQGIVGSKDFF